MKYIYYDNEKIKMIADSEIDCKFKFVKKNLTDEQVFQIMDSSYLSTLDKDQKLVIKKKETKKEKIEKVKDFNELKSLLIDII